MRIIKLTEETRNDLLTTLLKRSPNQYSAYEDTVNEIVENVRSRKDQALFEYTEKFDHITLTRDTVQVTPEEIDDAYRKVDPELLAVIRRALANIRAYHEKQKDTPGLTLRKTGSCWGRRSAPYPGSVYMSRAERRYTRPPC